VISLGGFLPMGFACECRCNFTRSSGNRKRAACECEAARRPSVHPTLDKRLARNDRDLRRREQQ
jgi:hypothetical protein